VKHWLFLLVAIVTEVFATSALKMSDGFSNLWPSVCVVLGYGTSFYFLALTLDKIPVGIAYAVWAGVGMVLITLVGLFAFGQKLDVAATIGIVLIIGGVLIMNLFSASVPK
jgi:small multidrug resistance pump